MGFPASALKQKIPGTSCKGLVEVGGVRQNLVLPCFTFIRHEKQYMLYKTIIQSYTIILASSS